MLDAKSGDFYALTDKGKEAVNRRERHTRRLL